MFGCHMLPRYSGGVRRKLRGICGVRCRCRVAQVDAEEPAQGAIIATRIYTVPATMRATDASRALVLGAIDSGELRAYRWGNRWLMSGEAVMEWTARFGEPGVDL